MPRKVRVTTTSFYGQQPRPGIVSSRGPARAAAAERADLLCLPENFPEIGLTAPERPIAESKEIFHTDDHVAKLAQVQLDFGHRAEVHAFTEENVFTLESHDPAWPVARIKAAYGLESFTDCHHRAEAIQDQIRMGVATLAGA